MNVYFCVNVFVCVMSVIFEEMLYVCGLKYALDWEVKSMYEDSWFTFC